MGVGDCEESGRRGAYGWDLSLPVKCSHRQRKYRRNFFGRFVAGLPVVFVNVSVVVDAQTGELKIGLHHSVVTGIRGISLDCVWLVVDLGTLLVVMSEQLSRNIKEIGLLHVAVENKSGRRRRFCGSKCACESPQADRHSAIFLFLLRDRPSIDERLVGSGRRRR